MSDAPLKNARKMSDKPDCILSPAKWVPFWCEVGTFSSSILLCI